MNTGIELVFNDPFSCCVGGLGSNEEELSVGEKIDDADVVDVHFVESTGFLVDLGDVSVLLFCWLFVAV